jgi:hypothetical protein
MEKGSEINKIPDNKNQPLSDYSAKIQTDGSRVPVEILLAYNTIGFKVVPLAGDSKTPLVKSTNEVYANPSLWTPEKIEQESYKFNNVATTLGNTSIKVENGEDLYLNVLDIDSDNVLEILYDTLEELKSKTFVTKTKKDCGYHVFWLSYSQNPPIGTARCRPGYEFEIKTDNSLGLITLPPSRHRDDPNFRYYCVGRQNRIIIDDTLYDRLLDLLKSECLVTSDSSGNDNDSGKATKSDSGSMFKILQDDKIHQIISYLRGSFQKGSRNDIVFGLSGLLFKNKISLPCARNLVSLLCDTTHDEEKKARVDTLSNTYSRGINGSEIKGATQLQWVLLRIHGRSEVVSEIL